MPGRQRRSISRSSRCPAQRKGTSGTKRSTRTRSGSTGCIWHSPIIWSMRIVLTAGKIMRISSHSSLMWRKTRKIQRQDCTIMLMTPRGVCSGRTRRRGFRRISGSGRSGGFRWHCSTR